MNIHIEKTEDRQNAILTLSGDITVQHASELCSLLKEAVNEEMDTALNVSGIEDVDMTFFQLMCSAHRSFTAKGKQFILSTGKNGLLKKGAATGFVRHKGCSRDKFGTCTMVMES
ncbi:STAS domain-containing protein [Seleniivibrio sp.]|uniref:STAS domain-containing protein n=1 Tax=Seleniivibrio sp. TaxID=2898801 RepID=UPI0025E1CF59|nr:STAS domain-containing protein [Seleniivibrio sp.]MCD8554473.1 STAS domain-containing protein [Seleniivibrio sp.]